MRRPGPDDATAFGQGCLEPGASPDPVGGVAPDDGSRAAGAEDPGSVTAPAVPDDLLVRLVDAARQEVAVLGHGRVGTEHLLLALVREGGEVGRAFGLRRAGAAVIAAACADGPTPGELVTPDGDAGLSTAATAALERARRRGAAHGRSAGPADLALGLLDAGRSASLLDALGVERDDLADVLAREDLDLPVTAPVRADVRPPVAAPIPVGTVAPVALMLPGAPPVVPDATAPLRIGPLPGSPARRTA